MYIFGIDVGIRMKIKRPDPPRPRKKVDNTWWKKQIRYSDGTFGKRRK